MDSTLGTRLAMARQRAGMTQAVLASLLGLGAASRISDWESGRTAPTAATIVRLPHVLGITGHWLLTGTGPMAVGEGNNEARIEAARKILSGDVSGEVVDMIAGRADPVQVASEAAHAAAVAKTLADSLEEATPEDTAHRPPEPSENLKD